MFAEVSSSLKMDKMESVRVLNLNMGTLSSSQRTASLPLNVMLLPAVSPALLFL